ncbi:glycosyltransferase family 4 protein [Patescibacteria group bacterium]|nr:glycosyltransferase family 4 protein [Patescibacteria group bacterium]MBU4512386.1 glycosyltransferase family 4 protein [Patescibacteria group bacterium]MCG2692495.1 glycosyltransferase family 4 protein [Candidatus Parcubacteria bacterium]
MKILYLYDFPLWGNGSANYLRNLVTQLSKRHEIAVLAPDQRQLEPNVKRYIVKLPFPCPVYFGHPELPNSKKYSELTGVELTKLYKAYLAASVRAAVSFKPDIIHTNHFGLLTWVASYIRSIFNVNFIATTHGSCLKHIETNRRNIPLTRNSLYDAKAITTISSHNKQWMLKLLGKDLRHRTKVIPGGLNFKKFSVNCSTARLDEKYNLVNENVALFVGRLTKEKGVEYLIRAADKIDGQIFIIGDGPEKANMEKLNQDLNNVNVRFLGYFDKSKAEELKEFYARADVFVAPSVCHEALGLVILEAMSYATPTVATRKGGIPLAVKNGKTGLFVKTRNVEDIALKVNQLFKDDNLRKKMGIEAKALVEKKFTWENIALGYEKIYKNIITGNGNGHSGKKIVSGSPAKSQKNPKKYLPKSVIKSQIKIAKKITKKI